MNNCGPEREYWPQNSTCPSSGKTATIATCDWWLPIMGWSSGKRELAPQAL
jgi:hypothetical protein